MKKSDKIKVKKKVESALAAILKQLKIAKPTKKTSKAISKASKAIRKELESQAKKARKYRLLTRGKTRIKSARQ